MRPPLALDATTELRQLAARSTNLAAQLDALVALHQGGTWPYPSPMGIALEQAAAAAHDAHCSLKDALAESATPWPR